MKKYSICKILGKSSSSVRYLLKVLNRHLGDKLKYSFESTTLSMTFFSLGERENLVTIFITNAKLFTFCQYFGKKISTSLILRVISKIIYSFIYSFVYALIH